MTPDAARLLGYFESAHSNEIIYGEGDFATMKGVRDYQVKTTAAKVALIAHIEKLERGGQALGSFVTQLEEMGIADPDRAVNGADAVDFLCQQYLTLKEALK